MSFSISGAVITQTGTDTNLSALASVAGVTTTTNGLKTIYYIGNNQLSITGTLTFDPQFEEIWLGTSINTYPQVEVTGTLNIGVPTTRNGVVFYPQCTAFVIPSYRATQDGESDDTRYASLRIIGTCHHHYGTIFCRGPVGFGTNATTGTYHSYSSSAGFISLGAAGSPLLEIQLRFRSNLTVVNGLTTKNIMWVLLASPSITNAQIAHADMAISTSSSSPPGVFLTVRDYVGTGGNTYDVGYRISTVWNRFINCGVGTSLKSAGNSASNTGNNNCGIHEIRQELTVTAKTQLSASITSGGIYLADRDWGNRCPYDTAKFGATQPNYTLDRDYAVLFNGAGAAAITADGGVLIGVNWRSISGSQNLQNQQDFRGEQNSATDFWVVRCRSYGKVFTDVSLTLRGVGGSNQGVTLFDNPDITQSSATAAAHTGITLTDHGASPISWNGKSFGITITVNKITNPGATAADLYHYLQYHLANVATSFNGKLGGAWHNMLRVEGAGFATVSGQYGGLRVVKGVRVIDESGNPFPGILRMQSNDGSYYTPPIQYQLQITNLVTGSDVVILEAGTATILDSVDQISGTTYAFDYVTPDDVDIGILMPGYKPFYIRNYTLQSADSVLPVAQVIDRSYQ